MAGFQYSLHEGRFDKSGMVSFGCPSCTQPIWAKRADTGHEVKCNHCGAEVRVPDISAAPAPANRPAAGGKAVLPPPRAAGQSPAQMQAPKKPELAAAAAAPVRVAPPIDEIPEAIVRKAPDAAGPERPRRPGRPAPLRKGKPGERPEMTPFDSAHLQVRRKFPLVPLLCVLGLIAVGAGAYFLVLKKSEPSAPVIDRPPPVAGATADEYDEAKRILEMFYATWSTPSMIVPHVRHPEETRPRMKAYSPPPGESPKIATVHRTTVPFEVGGTKFLRMRLAQEDGILRTAIFERTGDGLLLDWESFVGYSDPSWLQFYISRPTKPASFYLIARRENFYIYPFSDASEYLCLKLTDPGVTGEVFGYAERESEVGKRLSKLVDGASRSGNPELLAILKLRFAESGRENRQVWIDEIVSETWIRSGSAADSQEIPEP
ncbi:MAG: hypothetical protein R3F11_19270 [Verrucomicrobiales bacterium]